MFILSLLKFFLAASIRYHDFLMCLINIYMPCDDRLAHSIVEYEQVLGELHISFEFCRRK